MWMHAYQKQLSKNSVILFDVDYCFFKLDNTKLLNTPIMHSCKLVSYYNVQTVNFNSLYLLLFFSILTELTSEPSSLVSQVEL